MEEKIKNIISEMNPYFNLEGGNIEFIKYEDNYVYVKIMGACSNCDYLDLDITYGLETYLKNEIPEIEGVINVTL